MPTPTLRPSLIAPPKPAAFSLRAILNERGAVCWACDTMVRFRVSCGSFEPSTSSPLSFVVAAKADPHSGTRSVGPAGASTLTLRSAAGAVALATSGAAVQTLDTRTSGVALRFMNEASRCGHGWKRERVKVIDVALEQPAAFRRGGCIRLARQPCEQTVGDRLVSASKSFAIPAQRGGNGGRAA